MRVFTLRFPIDDHGIIGCLRMIAMIDAVHYLDREISKT